jgi:ribonucleotide reductase alpha subunit
VTQAQAALAEAQKMLATDVAAASTDWDAVLQAVARAQTWLEVATRAGAGGRNPAH